MPRFLLLACTLLVAACVSRGGDPTRPIPTAYHPAPVPGQRLVIVLPGRGDDLASLQRRDIASLIQASWPDADVITTGLTMPYYLDGQAVQRLHDEIVAPERRRGTAEIWLLGISLGGTGALLYERMHPGEVTGLLLLSPYLGEAGVHGEIREAGGLAQWTLGPEPALDVSNFQRELWRAPWQWTREPDRASSVWLSYGNDEPFRVSGAVLAQALPPSNVRVLEGRHNWGLWSRATTVLLREASARPRLDPTHAAPPVAAGACREDCPTGTSDKR